MTGLNKIYKIANNTLRPSYNEIKYGLDVLDKVPGM